MLPPSATFAAVVIALSWTRRLLPSTSEILPALPAWALVAEIVPCLVTAMSAVLIVMLPPAPPAVAFDETAAPEMLTEAGGPGGTSPPRPPPGGPPCVPPPPPHVRGVRLGARSA